MTQHDAAADLAYIRGVMEQTRHYTAAKGGYFVLWGCVISAALAVTWAQASGLLGGSQFLSWCLAMVAGWIGTAVLVWQEQRATVVPPMARQVGFSWMAVGLAMAILFFVGVPAGTLPPKLLPALSALFVGVGIYNTGSLTGLDWLRGVAGGWFLGAIYMLVFPGAGVQLAMAVLLVLFQIVPGLVLVKQARARRG